MPDFHFLQNSVSQKWIISAPRRANRPDIAHGTEPVCPFCVGREHDEQELYRVGGEALDAEWQIRVIPNKFPFAPIHEVVIHSPDHHKSFDELPLPQIEIIFKTYRHRYNEHAHKGQVYIFHNHGQGGGESLPHPHTQIAVIPGNVRMDIPRLDSSLFNNARDVSEETTHFSLYCPTTSQWPDEVWISPKQSGRVFGEITDDEISDFAFVIQRIIQIFDVRHGHEFPFNFYIYPGGNWYLRLIPRLKILGGFEVGTGVFVTTQEPQETIAFIKEHFHNPDYEKIKREHFADYHRSV